MAVHLFSVESKVQMPVWEGKQKRYTLLLAVTQSGYTLRSGSQNLSLHQNHLESLVKQIAGLHHQRFWPVGLDRGLRICIWNKFPGDADNLEGHTVRTTDTGDLVVSS